MEKAYHAQNAGAKAVIVADNLSEDLLTMASPEDRPELAPLIAKLNIPTVLITRDAGDQIKSALQRSTVTAELDWSESIAHPDARVEYEFWFTTNDVCGEVCTSQRAFFKSFKDTAASLEQQGYTQFTPHVMLRSCQFGGTDCDRDCTRGRRYCAVEPIPAAYAAQYTGADVVEMNTRHLCAFQVANLSSSAQGQTGAAPWWDFAGRFATSCSMETSTFTADCVREQLVAAGIDADAVERCVDYRNTDAPLDILEAQVRAQADVDSTGRGRIIMLPTVVINFDQYRGSLTAAGVLRALCSGFQEGTEPQACLSGGLEVDECASGNHGCWNQGDLTACVDTFRGFACRCPAGWQGDGHMCADIDECALGISGCDQICINTPGSYHCDCNTGYTLHGGQGGPGMCVPNDLSAGGGGSGVTNVPGWMMAVLFCASVASLSVAGIAFYRWKMHQSMQGEIRAIMREYMPLPGGDDAAEAGRFGRGGSIGSLSGPGQLGKAPARAEETLGRQAGGYGGARGDTQLSLLGRGGSQNGPGGGPL